MAHQEIKGKESQTVNLSYMECFTSCVLTFLNFNGYDYRKVLLDYWNLNYQFKTLLSSKDAQRIPLDFLYGIEMKFIKGDSETLFQSIRDGSSVICFCQASKLDFFPRENLGMESSGFQHSILVYGWEEVSKKYYVADPTVRAIVQMDPEEILKAGAARRDRNELHYFVLTKTSVSYAEPDIRSCIRNSTRRNLHFYNNENVKLKSPTIEETPPDELKKKEWQLWFSNRKSGARALEAFESDLVQSADWTHQARTAWIKRNNVMIASIRRIRAAVWQTYLETGRIGQKRVGEGQEQIDSISGLWNNINLRLLKSMKAQEIVPAVQSISLLIDQLKREEIRFLEWLIAAAEEGD
jgi:hypothetical protein